MKLMKFGLIISFHLCSVLLLQAQTTDSLTNINLKSYSGFWESILPDSSILTWEINMTIMNQGIYSVGQIKSKHGNLIYQADALWNYDSKSNELIMYEINSAGIPMIHIGRFNSSTKIYVERFDQDGIIIQQSELKLVKHDKLVFTMKHYEGEKVNQEKWIFNKKE